MDKYPNLPKYIAIGIGSASVVGLILYYRYKIQKRQKLENLLPTNWTIVGEITDVLCYPIKSCGVVRLKETNCSLLGVQDELLRDRVFMVTDDAKNFVTARQQPKLVRIFPKIQGRILKLTASGMLDIEVNVDKLLQKSKIRCRVWGQDVDVIDCGEDVGKWISRFVLKRDSGLHLVYFSSEHPTRPVRQNNKIFPELSEDHVGALHDATSFMMINESSIAELNSRLDSPVTAMNFRPNIVIKGPPAFSEDDFKWVRIGNDTIFKAVKPCTRCIFTTVDPETGVKDAFGEPLNTLKSYRLFPGLGSSPVMGLHLGVMKPGKIKLGDSVYIGNISTN